MPRGGLLKHPLAMPEGTPPQCQHPAPVERHRPSPGLTQAHAPNQPRATPGGRQAAMSGWKNGGSSRTSTAAHRKWRAQVLKDSGGRCQIKGPRCQGVAVFADHKVPVAEGGAEYDPSNGQGACEPCHKAKTLEEAARGRARMYKPKRRRGTGKHPGLRW